MSGLPEWVVRQLVEQGHLTRQRLGSRVQAQTCRCGQLILTALTTRPLLKSEPKVEIAPVDETGELVALAAGRRTWEVFRVGDHHEIDYRDEWEVRGRPPAKALPTTIHADHVCGAAPLPASTLVQPKAHRPALTAEPAF